MKKLMKEKRRRKSISILLALCLVVGLPATALAAAIADNPVSGEVSEIVAGDTMHTNDGTVTTNKGFVGTNNGTVTTNEGEIGTNNGTVTTHNGIMSYNHGTIADNSGEVIDNYSGAEITTNGADGTVFDNYGTIKTNNGSVMYNNADGVIDSNSGTVENNYGTITNNTGGTVKYNLGGAVTGGTVANDYQYKITNTENDENVSFYGGTDDVDAVQNVGGTVYVKKNTPVIISAMPGYTLSGAPKITSGGGNIAGNGDGTYTLTGVTGDVTITVTTVYIPVTDILGIPDSITAGTDIYLDDVVTVTPEGANDYIWWEVIDAGTTGAAIDNSAGGLLSTTAAGTVKIKATIENGKSETEDFVKEFTITVKNLVDDVFDAYTTLQSALAGNDLEKLKMAAKGFESVLDTFNGMNEEQLAALGTKLGVTGEEAYNMILSDWIDTNIVLEIEKLYSAYLADPNQDTASAFIEYYDAVFNDANYDDTQKLIRKFIPDIDDVYDDALALLNGSAPSGNTNDDNTTSANTGDDSNMLPWVILASTAAMVGAGAAFGRRRRTEK